MTYTNGSGVRYYVHVAKTKTGRDRFYVSTKAAGTLAHQIPTGYEIYENPNGRVFLRRKLRACERIGLSPTQPQEPRFGT